MSAIAQGLRERVAARAVGMDAGLGVGAILGVLATWPLWAPGIPDMADGAVHFYRTLELELLWREGVRYPRWAPHMLYGHGYPLFNFAPPLFYYLALGFRLLGAHLELAFKAAVASASALGSLLTYLWIRDLVTPRAGLIAAALVAFAPYRLRELTIQGNFAQFLALALLPGLAWALDRARRRPDSSAPIWLALFLGAIVLSHNITAMYAALATAAYVAVTALRDRRAALIMTAGIGLGLGLSAFFWLPALGEARFTRVQDLTEAYFDFRLHFVPAQQLVAPTPFLDSRAANPFVPFTLGWPQVTLLAAGALALLSGWRLPERIPLILWTALAAGTTLMALAVSRPLWEALPFLAFTEFPWRLLGLASTFLAAPAGLGAEALLRLLPEPRLKAAAPGILAALLPLFQWGLTYQPQTRLEYGREGAGDILAYELRTGAIGTTSAGEYLPPWVVERPRPPSDASQPLEPGAVDQASVPAGGSVERLAGAGTELGYRLELSEPARLRLRLLWFPGWSAWLDGRPIPLGVEPRTGLVTVEAPGGSAILVLRFADTPLRRAAAALGLASLLILVGLVTVPAARLARRAPPSDGTPGGRHPAPATLLWTLGALVLVWGARAAFVDARTRWFRIDSPPMAVAGADHPADATLEGSIRLLGYDLQPREVSPGEVVEVVLYWQALRPIESVLSSFVHLTLPHDPRVVTQQDNVHPGGIPVTRWDTERYIRDAHRMVLPGELPSLALVPRVGLYDANAPLERWTVTEGETVLADPHASLTLIEGALVLEPVWVLSAPPPPPRLLAAHLDGSIRLEGYGVERQGSELEVILWWRPEAPLERDWTVFVHVLDGRGRLVAQSDGRPVQGRYPTDWWLPGQRIVDAHRIELPAASSDASPDVRLLVGLYDIRTGERAPVTVGGEPAPDRAVSLPPP